MIQPVFCFILSRPSFYFSQALRDMSRKTDGKTTLENKYTAESINLLSEKLTAESINAFIEFTSKIKPFAA